MRVWIFPNSPEAYDLQPDFDRLGKIDWFKNRKVKTGDIVYLYRSSPVKKILWKCEVGEIDYYLRDNDDYTYSYVETEEFCHGPCCEILPLITFEPMEELSFHSLREHGLKSSLMGGQTISQELIDYLESVEKNLDRAETSARYAEGLSLDQLKEQAKKQSGKEIRTFHTDTKQYARNGCVSQYAKVRANGVCQLCGKPAPFYDKTGKPYLESHHIIWLSRGGADSIDNVAALCPNCHKKMHILDLESDVQILLDAIREDI